MPGINGLDLCRQYRQKEGYQTPVIMLTALGTTEDIVKGLDAGADDYLVKPFSFQELEARIKALLRRGRETPALQLTCNDLVLDCNPRRAQRGEISIDPVGKKPGRGAYLCPDAACLAKAKKKKALERCFEQPVPAEVYDALAQQLASVEAEKEADRDGKEA